jgi:hypothetical protein
VGELENELSTLKEDLRTIESLKMKEKYMVEKNKYLQNVLAKVFDKMCRVDLLSQLKMDNVLFSEDALTSERIGQVEVCSCPF